ncbi:MAG: cobalamin-dependent protein [bacterium]
MISILLINPYGTEQSGFTSPPLGLLYIAGTLLKNGFEVQVVDGCIDGKEAVKTAIERLRPSFIGITCLTPGRVQAMEIARMAKSIIPHTTVVMGGVHPTIMYKQLLETCQALDFAVLGEGEQTFLEIVQGKAPGTIPGLAFRDGKTVVTTEHRRYIDNLDDLPLPAWHLVDLRRYPPIDRGIFRGIDLKKVPRISVIFSRGCKGHCDFCSTWWIWKGWRHRSPKAMADEIEMLYRDYGVRHLCFADDSMTVDKQATITLCDEIIARNLNIVFHVTTRTDCVDKAVLQRLKQAGCYKIAFGIETGSSLLLEKMGKENDIKTSESAIALAKEAGILVTALIIVGNVGETPESIQDTVSFLRRTRPDEVGCVGELWILPGTQLYRHCKQKGFIDDSYWLSDKPYKSYTLEHTPKELARFQRLILHYNSPVGFALAGIRDFLRECRASVRRIGRGQNSPPGPDAEPILADQVERKD